MNAEQQQAYDWAKSHDYSSVAAQYARVLATVVDSLRADLARVTAERDAAVADMKLGIEDRGCEVCKKYATRHECDTCEFEWRGLKGEMQE